MKHYYRQLGVAYSATMQEIESAYQRELDALKCLPSDDQDYIKEKRARLKEAYYAILLHHETGQNPPDTVIGDADAMEAMLIKARLDKNEIPESAKVKVKNNGKDVALAIGFLIGLFIAAELLVALFPAKLFDSTDYVYLAQYEQAEAEDLYIAEVAAASKKYIEAYAVDYPKDVSVRENNKGSVTKGNRWEKKFIKLYWGYESFGEVTDYLCETYKGYHCDSSYDGSENVIYAFYGFMPYKEFIGYRNPFTGKVFNQSYEIYKFYVQFYKAYQNGEIPE